MAAIPPGHQAHEDWLPAGEEPLAAHNIAHYAVLRHNGVSVLSLPSGDIDATLDDAESTGLYHQDTRYLSRLVVSFGGVAPRLLDAREVDGGLSAIFTNPAVRAPHDGRMVPAQTLVLRRLRAVDESLVESITVSNYGLEPVAAELRVGFDVDFKDIFEVRGHERSAAAGPITRSVADSAVRFACTGVDGRTRTATIRFDRPPDALDHADATFALALGPRETFAVDLEVAVGHERPMARVSAAREALEHDAEQWARAVTGLASDNDGLELVVRRALNDVRSLWTRTDEYDYVAAGVPWFDTLFGRDSLITGIELLAWAPSVLRVALRVLARYQATEDDPVHDATPGKLPHELRWGELAAAGEVPFGRYYGSVDVTPLFVYAAWEYFRWTGDSETVGALWPAIERAARWCRDNAAAGVSGCLSYSRVSARGLENQGWKDSHDAIVWPDGRRVDGPIALIEVQGYLAAAMAAHARLTATLGKAGASVSEGASRGGAAYGDQIDRLFGDDTLGYALCLDGRGQPVPTVASNAGHLLWCGAARPDLAARVAERLFADDSFSGWGIRTLAASMGRFNPLGYHTGSVWPHDNALTLAGLRAYGFDERAEVLATALLEAAGSFPDRRAPELFSGDARDLRQVPTPYPVASRPQAWSAASVPYVLTSTLGLQPGRPGQLAIVRPRLPARVEWIRLRNLRFQGGSAGLCFRRAGERVAVEVESITGGIEVTLSEEWPNDPASARRPADGPGE